MGNDSQYQISRSVNWTSRLNNEGGYLDVDKRVGRSGGLHILNRLINIEPDMGPWSQVYSRKEIGEDKQKSQIWCENQLF